jgi:hypothetical protein
LGIIFAVVFGLLTFILLEIFRKKKPVRGNSNAPTPENP